ncbi:MAG TPA: GNAT family N-acetyltransferase [Ignavibacteria bacterium]|nr:GNAT family N-acetyltransferase [Ignavibacteria bacterium]
MQIFNDEVFTEFPVIETRNLILREFNSEDAEVLFQNYSDKEVMKYFGRELFKDFSEAEIKIENTNSDFKNKLGIRWAVCLKSDKKQMLGSCGYWRILKEHLRAEIGYELSKEFWGKGIMTEALQAIIEFGFTGMKLHSIEANIDPENLGSVKILEKLGFVREGYFKDSFLFQGKFTDTSSYSLINITDSFNK